MVDLTNKADNLLPIFGASDVYTKLNTCNDTLPSVLDIHAPMKSVKIRSRSFRFVNQEIKDLMKSRDGLLKRFHQTRDAVDWANFKESRNLVKKTLHEAARNHTFEEVTLHQKNPNSHGKIINRVLHFKIKERQIYSKDLKYVAN